MATMKYKYSNEALALEAVIGPKPGKKKTPALIPHLE